MLYLSLVLIIAGLLLLLFGLFAGTGKPVYSDEIVVRSPSLGYGPSGIREAHADRKRTVRKQPAWKEDFTDPSFEKPDEGSGVLPAGPSGSDVLMEDGILEELNAHYDDGGETAFPNAESSEQMAVLYEDASGLINYEDGSSLIDSGLDSYRHLKRLGSGRIELASEGINFHAGRRFFRFDFRRVEKLKIGRNFFVLFLQGNQAARLFLFNAETPFLHQVRKRLEHYLKDAG